MTRRTKKYMAFKKDYTSFKNIIIFYRKNPNKPIPYRLLTALPKWYADLFTPRIPAFDPKDGSFRFNPTISHERN